MSGTIKDIEKKYDDTDGSKGELSASELNLVVDTTKYPIEMIPEYDDEEEKALFYALKDLSLQEGFTTSGTNDITVEGSSSFKLDKIKLNKEKILKIVPENNNTGAVTVTVGGLTKSLKLDGDELEADYLVAGHEYQIRYNEDSDIFEIVRNVSTVSKVTEKVVGIETEELARLDIEQEFKKGIWIRTSDDNRIELTENEIHLYSKYTDDDNRSELLINKIDSSQNAQFVLKDADGKDLSRISFNGDGSLFHDGFLIRDAIGNSDFVMKGLDARVDTGNTFLKNYSFEIRRVTDQGGSTIRSDSSLFIHSGEYTPLYAVLAKVAEVDGKDDISEVISEWTTLIGDSGIRFFPYTQNYTDKDDVDWNLRNEFGSYTTLLSKKLLLTPDGVTLERDGDDDLLINTSHGKKIKFGTNFLIDTNIELNKDPDQRMRLDRNAMFLYTAYSDDDNRRAAVINLLDNTEKLKISIIDENNDTLKYMLFSPEGLFINEINRNEGGNGLNMFIGESRGLLVPNIDYEALNLCAEKGILIRTPDRAHSNFEDGWEEVISQLTGDYLRIGGTTDTRSYIYNNYHYISWGENNCQRSGNNEIRLYSDYNDSDNRRYMLANQYDDGAGFEVDMRDNDGNVLNGFTSSNTLDRFYIYDKDLYLAKGYFRITPDTDNHLIKFWDNAYNIMEIGALNSILIGRRSNTTEEVSSINTLGHYAGDNIDGANDLVLIGYGAGRHITTGTKSVFVGSYSGGKNTTGESNVFIGHNAGNNSKTGDNNICIGYDSETSSDDVSNEVTVGNDDNDSYRMYASGWTNVSDSRDKTNITPLEKGLEYLSKFTPKWYEWNMRSGAKQHMKGKTQLGFIAQDFLEISEIIPELKDTGFINTSDKDQYMINNDILIPILTKSVQELDEKNKELEMRLERLEALLLDQE